MKNFFDMKNEKITEKAFSHSLIISVFSILMCLILLCSMTYAWFSADVSSGNNTIKAGNFDLTVSVVPFGEDVEALSENENGAFELSSGKYTVTLSMTEDTTVTKGYCIITRDGKDCGVTEAIYKDKEYTFDIEVEKDGEVVIFKPSWSLPSDYEDYTTVTPNTDNTETDVTEP